jgi:uncharacterized membrane protein
MAHDRSFAPGIDREGEKERKDPMKPTVIGTFVGLLLGLALVLQGFGDMLIVALIGAIGYVIGKVVAGEVDLGRYLGQRRTGPR